MNIIKCRPRPALMALILAAASAGCASTGSASGPSTRGDITAEDLVDFRTETLYDAIQRLRPRWLRTRSSVITAAGGPTAAKVYVDGAPRGDIEALRDITAREVTRVSFMDGPDATTRYGTDHTGGAILVITGASPDE